MTPLQYHATLTTTTAGLLRQAGFKIIAASAINGRPWLKARMPAQLTPDDRINRLSLSWQTPDIVEWRSY